MAVYWYYSVLVCLLCFLLSFNPVCGEVNQPLTDALIKLQHEGVKKAQILKWFQVTYNRLNGRVFPICIRKQGNAYPPSLAKWGPILDNIDLHTERLATPHHVYNPIASKIASFKVLNVLQSDKTDGWTSGKTHKFNQWIHVHATFKKGYEAKGVFIQAITGPLGLPGGEFDNNLFCFDTTPHPNLQQDPKWNQGSFTHPCTISPRSATRWPNIFVFDGTRVSPDFTTSSFSFRFRWTEAQCQETGFFQFVYIITPSFSPQDYEVRIAPIYSLKDRQSETGIATGAYLGFVKGEGYHCNQATPVDANAYGSVVLTNAEHDHCVTTGEGMDKHYTCPPGPFKCKELWSTNAELNKRIQKWDEDNGRSARVPYDCCELGDIPPDPAVTKSTTTTAAPPGPGTPPSNTTTTSPPTRFTTTLLPEQKVEKQLGNRATEAEKASQVTHGDVCVLVWLVIIPLADHVARYYKDFPDFQNLGLGFWIISHVLLHITGLVLIWYSFGLVVGTGDNKLGNVSGAHLVLGAFTTILQHVGFFTALHQFDDISVSEAFKFVASHALGGKAAFVFAFFSIVLSNSNMWKRLVCGGLVIFRGITIIITIYLELKQDAHIGLHVHRARCPVLQRIVMEHGVRPPMMKTKILVLIFMVSVLVLGFICILIFFDK